MTTASLAGRAMRLLLAVGLTAYLIFWKTDPSAIAAAIGRARWSWLAAALALVVIDRVLMAWRWIALLKDDARARLPLSRLIRIFLVSTFLGTFLPAGVGGDVVRTWSLSRERVAGAEAAGTVLMDRLLGVVALVLLAGIGLFLGRHLLPESFLVTALAGAALACAAGLAVVYSEIAESLLLWIAARLPAALRVPAARLVAAVRAYSTRHGIVTAVFVASIAVNALRVVQAWMLGLSLGLHQPGLVYFAFVPMITLIMQIPITIFGLGVAQLGFDWFFTHAGVSSADALALSFLFLGLGLAGNLPGALLYAAGPASRAGVSGAS